MTNAELNVLFHKWDREQSVVYYLWCAAVYFNMLFVEIQIGGLKKIKRRIYNMFAFSITLCVKCE